MKDKSIVIHRESEGVFHFDGDPIMGGKDLKVEIIQGGLNVVAPETHGTPWNRSACFSILQTSSANAQSPV